MVREGLPVAVQIQARRWRDPFLLEIAAAMEKLVEEDFIPPLTAPTHKVEKQQPALVG